MTALLFIFPVFFVLIAIGAFFITINESKGKLLLIGGTIVLLIFLAGNELTVYMQVMQTQKLQAQVVQTEDWKTGQIARMNTLLATMNVKAQRERDKLASLADLGWSSANPQIQQALEANDVRQELFDNMPQAQNPAIIVNLPNAVDKMLLAFSLEEMGFVVSANQSQDQYIDTTSETDEQTEKDTNADIDEQNETGDETLKKGEIDEIDEADATHLNSVRAKPEVNALMFGHLVRHNDIKLVLYTMLRAGIEIKYVKVFKSQSNANARQIKFVYSKLYTKRAPYSVDIIKNIKLFKR